MAKPSYLLMLVSLTTLAMAVSAESTHAKAPDGKISATLTAGRFEKIAIRGKLIRADSWSTRTTIAALPCKGKHELTVVTRYEGDATSRSTYRIAVSHPRLRSGQASCGVPVPARYGDRRVRVTLAPVDSNGSEEFNLTGRRTDHGGPFDLRLRFQALTCAGRYVLRIRMDGPDEPLRIRYRTRVSQLHIDGELRECG